MISHTGVDHLPEDKVAERPYQRYAPFPQERVLEAAISSIDCCEPPDRLQAREWPRYLYNRYTSYLSLHSRKLHGQRLHRLFKREWPSGQRRGTQDPFP